MKSNGDAGESYRSPVSNAHSIGAVMLFASAGIAFDKAIVPGHVLFVSFAVLLTLLCVSIFRKVLRFLAVWRNILATITSSTSSAPRAPAATAVKQRQPASASMTEQDFGMALDRASSAIVTGQLSLVPDRTQLR